MKNEFARKTSQGQIVPAASSERYRIVQDERIETRFLTDLLKMIGAD